MTFSVSLFWRPCSALGSKPSAPGALPPPANGPWPGIHVSIAFPRKASNSSNFSPLHFVTFWSGSPWPGPFFSVACRGSSRAVSDSYEASLLPMEPTRSFIALILTSWIPLYYTSLRGFWSYSLYFIYLIVVHSSPTAHGSRDGRTQKRHTSCLSFFIPISHSPTHSRPPESGSRTPTHPRAAAITGAPAARWDWSGGRICPVSGGTPGPSGIRPSGFRGREKASMAWSGARGCYVGCFVTLSCLVLPGTRELSPDNGAYMST